MALSNKVYQTHLSRLQTKQPLTKSDLKALVGNLNCRVDSMQLHALLNAAQNCNCSTPNGLLVGFEASYCYVYGDYRFKPVFIKNNITALLALKG